MAKVYVEPIKSDWKDDVGGRQSRAANQAAETLNAAAARINETFREVERSQSRQLNFKPRTPEIVEIQERLERELGV